MITYVKGNLFESPTQVLVNTVNTVGVMGKGIAKDFKSIYPEMFEKYRHLCEAKKLTVGKLWLFKTPFKWILNFPTKTTWKQPSKLEYIEMGLQAFKKNFIEKKITSIAFPALGCGNGELNWDKQVRPLMEKHLSALPIDIFIYLYDKKLFPPEHRNIKEISEWLRSEPENLSFHEVWEDIKAQVDKNNKFTTFYSNCEFTIRYLKDAEGEFLSVDWRDGNEKIYYEEILNFWKTLQSYGFIFPDIIPSMAYPYKEYLLSVFDKLPYCREISIAKKYVDISRPLFRGLQFLPRTAVQSPLFQPKTEQYAFI